MGNQPADEIEALVGQINRYHLVLMGHHKCTHREMFSRLSQEEQSAWAELYDARLSYLRPPRGGDYKALTQTYLDLLKRHVETWVDTWPERSKSPETGPTAAPEAQRKRLYVRWFDFGSFQLPCPWLTSR